MSGHSGTPFVVRTTVVELNTSKWTIIPYDRLGKLSLLGKLHFISLWFVVFTRSGLWVIPVLRDGPSVVDICMSSVIRVLKVSVFRSSTGFLMSEDSSGN